LTTHPHRQIPRIRVPPDRMAQGAATVTPGLSSFLKSLRTTPVDPSVEHFTS
jgi:hypothetical protein